MSVLQALTELTEKINANPEGITGFSAVYHFRLHGEDGGDYQVNFANGQASFVKGTPDEAGCTLELSDANFIKLIQGSLNPAAAFITGKLKIKGEMSLSLKLQTVLYTYQT